MHRRATPDHRHHHDHDHPHHYAGWPWRRTTCFLAIAAVLAWTVSGVYVVQPNERAAVWRFGRILPETSMPGIHFGLPYGLDRVSRVKMFEQKRVSIGGGLDDRNRGRTAEPRRAECLAGDRNLIEVSAVVQYEIVDAKEYLVRAGDVPATIENMATAELSSQVAARAVDDIFTTGRADIQLHVLAALKVRLGQLEEQGLGIGVQVNGVSLELDQPPQEVEPAFRDVVAAREDRQRAINEAEGYAAALLPASRGEAERTRREAEGTAAETTEKARGEADRFKRMLAQLSVGRELTIRRLVLETMEEVMPRLKKIVVDERSGKPIDLGILEDQ
jgi:membrane protease subunit HflK